jgi:putative spermidine/putrescine transport system permease protein
MNGAAPNRMTRWILGAVTVLVLLFLFVPLAIILVYAFDASNIQAWPIRGFTLVWFTQAWNDDEVRAAFILSAEVAASATVLAVVLGSLAAFAMRRLTFFGKEAISFVIVLPIALPGIITGMAFNSYFAFWGLDLSIVTIVIAHATFCMVIVYNNVIARLRRLPSSYAEASMDLGAGPFLTFRRITLPMIASAVGAGALLAFALSFDEVIVTTFTAGVQSTLPLWIFGAIRLGQRLPEVNVVVFAVIALTIIPVLLAQKLMGGAGSLHK